MHCVSLFVYCNICPMHNILRCLSRPAFIFRKIFAILVYCALVQRYSNIQGLEIDMLDVINDCYIRRLNQTLFKFFFNRIKETKAWYIQQGYRRWIIPLPENWLNFFFLKRIFFRFYYGQLNGSHILNSSLTYFKQLYE